MAFETSILQNGEWTTRTLDVNTVLRHYDLQDQEATANTAEIERAPVLGLLTQTVIRSPLVHWILPVKLRDPETNDVAFIGDEFVQIKQLRADGQLWDVIRKDNFGARIRNARVVGSTDAFLRDQKRQFRSTQIKDEDGCDGMDIDTNANRNPPKANLLPPQAILIQLDSGDSVFLTLRQSGNGTLEFVSSRHRVSKAMLKLQPGTHLAIDPSSRFMAIGCSEGVFAIYALKSRANLQELYSQGTSLRYVEAERHIYLQGVILKIDFLYPSSDDEEHIILLVLMIRKGKTRMLLYEWDTSGDLREVRAHSRRGHLLEEARHMPLLIIPLTIKSAFILVSATSMSICRGILHGSPQFIDMNDQIDPPTSLFHGSGIPLWTSWARPVRLPHHTASRDDIYIVREDGFVKFIETDCGEEGLVKTQMNIGPLSCNCGPALACLDYVKPNDTSADLLVSSGDSCSGAAHLIEARKLPIFTEYIHNWSPSHDFVMAGQDRAFAEQSKPAGRDIIQQPDRTFTCAGRGLNGTVTEFRYGLEASFGLEIPYDSQIMDVWVLPPDSGGIDGDEGSVFLLSLGDRSSVLYLSSDATEIVELEPEEARFDLAARTIAASTHDQYRIQVTEQSVVFLNGANFQKLSEDELLGVYENGTFIGSGENVDLAIIHDTTVLFTTRIGRQSYLQIVELTPANTIAHESPITLATRNLSQYPPNATCLSIGSVAQNLCVITAEYDRASIRLVFQPLHAIESRVLDIPPPDDWHQTRMEAFTSVVIVPGSLGHFIVVCGTRDGMIVTLEVNEHTLQIARSWYDRIGLTSVIIMRNELSNPKDTMLVNCDLKIYALKVPAIASGLSKSTRKTERKLYRIFLTDALKPIIEQPQINMLARLRPSLSGGTDFGLLLVSGSLIRLAGLSTQPKAVPRHIPIGGSPSRIIYSRHLGCLIVAATVNGRSTLLFIDPETGDDLSSPVDKKNGNTVSYVPGLGNLNERIFRLIEWSYVKGGKTWVFVIVCTNTGRLVILSTQKAEMLQSKGSEVIFGQQHKIRYWTLHKVKRANPIYSVAGFDEGLIYCSGKTLHCEILDMVEKKFRQVAQYVLPSPAINLAWKDGKIYALTVAHSLEILRLDGEATLDAASADDSGHKIVRTHGDQVTRDALHHESLTHGLEFPIHLVSDKACSVVGLWVTHNTRADTLEPVFEAQLASSILRFRSGRTRPIWDSTLAPKPDMGTSRISRLKSDYQEMLGLSIDGSLFSFTVLGPPAWRFLKLLIILAKQSPKICEFTDIRDGLSLESTQEPKIMMHVDGDILRRCLDDGSLDELLRTGQETGEAVAIQAKFVELIQGLHGEELERDTTVNVLIEQAYKDLEFFLRPVL